MFACLLRRVVDTNTSYATYGHVVLATTANKRSLNTKNGQFTHLLIFFMCVERCRRKTLRKERTKWRCRSTNGIERLITTLRSCMPNFGAKRLNKDVWLSFLVRNFSMIIDVYTSFSIEVERSSVLVIIQWWEVVCAVCKLAVSCHSATQLSQVKLKSQKRHNHVSMYDASSFCSDLKLTSLSKITWTVKR